MSRRFIDTVMQRPGLVPGVCASALMALMLVALPMDAARAQDFSYSTSNGVSASPPYDPGVVPPAQGMQEGIEGDVRALTGQVERLQFEMMQLKTQYEKQIADLTARLAALEGNAAPPQTPAAQATQTTAPTPSAADQTIGAITGPAPAQTKTDTLAGIPATDPAAAYEESYAALKAGDHTVAEQGFRAFLANHPKHLLAPNAKYWLGETFFARKDYVNAARIFAEGYKSAPKGPKAADNLLKLGLSLAGQNKTREACVALSQIRKDFPAGPTAVLTRADSEAKRLACAG